MGWAGLPINCFAFVYACWVSLWLRSSHGGASLTHFPKAMLWVCFPVSVPVAAESMNYAIVMFSGVFFIALICYAVQGRHVYLGPVVNVNSDVFDERDF